MCVKLYIIEDRCTQCGKCVEICHKGPLIFDIDKKEIKSMEYCNVCRLCITVCPENALKCLNE
ncbi:MAG: 4Fe-4S binding protein [Theionarchaea archaeon]|nr:4Fe-4S binding protein [Theionarchaea archaeon]MBU7001169.1 4Fe-4S binding protein [Theionarchaea archaeon]MBU7019948.1 4Fe-4S binding protein [Theionarchaea archaeon]MBU7034040.1 4Fe-4S binding protein [Theionarchaea archaeon]